MQRFRGRKGRKAVEKKLLRQQAAEKKQVRVGVDVCQIDIMSVHVSLLLALREER